MRLQFIPIHIEPEGASTTVELCTCTMEQLLFAAGRTYKGPDIESSFKSHSAAGTIRKQALSVIVQGVLGCRFKVTIAPQKPEGAATNFGMFIAEEHLELILQAKQEDQLTENEEAPVNPWFQPSDGTIH
jgi:hypothetical protein